MKKNSGKLYSSLYPVIWLIFTMQFFGAEPNIEKPVSPVAAIESIAPDSVTNPVYNKLTLYEGMNLDKLGLSKEAFEYGVKGFQNLIDQGKVANDKILTIIDFSKPSTDERMYVLDMENLEVLYQTYVSHGVNSGKLYATKFSNVTGSYMSSLGFYVTKNTYSGEHGFSLKLDGLEKGINDNAFRRAIVMHSADYASKGFIRLQGYLGRSYGCPALPKEVSKPIIETIKDGSCVFIYAPLKSYESKSKLI